MLAWYGNGSCRGSRHFVGVASSLKAPTPTPISIETVKVAPHPFVYRAAGEFSRSGQPTDAPLITIDRASPLQIMKQQVTAQDYHHCVTDGRCISATFFRQLGP